MYHYTNEKRVIKLPSLAFKLLLEKVKETPVPWRTLDEVPSHLKGPNERFEFMGVIYEEERDSVCRSHQFNKVYEG